MIEFGRLESNVDQTLVNILGGSAIDYSGSLLNAFNDLKSKLTHIRDHVDMVNPSLKRQSKAIVDDGMAVAKFRNRVVRDPWRCFRMSGSEVVWQKLYRDRKTGNVNVIDISVGDIKEAIAMCADLSRRLLTLRSSTQSKEPATGG